MANEVVGAVLGETQREGELIREMFEFYLYIFTYTRIRYIFTYLSMNGRRKRKCIGFAHVYMYSHVYMGERKRELRGRTCIYKRVFFRLEII